MNALAFHLLTVLATATATSAVPPNALLTELVEKGVTMPDGSSVRLPAPTMAEGLTAAQQAAVLASIAPRGDVQGFLAQGPTALHILKVGKTLSHNGKGPDLIRSVNLHFVVYGDWEVLTSDKFSKTILKEEKTNNSQSMVSKAGYMKRC